MANMADKILFMTVILMKVVLSAPSIHDGADAGRGLFSGDAAFLQRVDGFGGLVVNCLD